MFQNKIFAKMMLIIALSAISAGLIAMDESMPFDDSVPFNSQGQPVKTKVSSIPQIRELT